MRDIDRIKPFLEKLELLWKQCPDLRFGQLVCILSKDKDLFNIEDDEMLDMIQTCIDIKLQKKHINLL